MEKSGDKSLLDQDWHHGELSKVEAEEALTASKCDCFLVRVCKGALTLSLIHHGQLHHLRVKHHRRGWYELESDIARYSFADLKELVAHYRCNNLGSPKIKLGAACVKKTPACVKKTTAGTIIKQYSSMTFKLYCF